MKLAAIVVRVGPLLALVAACASSASPKPPGVVSTPDEVSLRLIAALGRDDMGGATADFSPTMARALGTFEIREVWGQLTSAFGALEDTSVISRSAKDGLEIRDLALRFQRGKAIGRVVVDPATGRVEGLFFRPAAEGDGAPAPEARKAAAVDGVRAQEITVGEAPWKLPGTLTLPAKPGRFPAVLLVHGSGPQNRDEALGPNRPFRDIAEDLARAGIASLRYDKRTLVYRQQLDAHKVTVEEEVIADAVAGLKLLRGHPEVRPDGLFVVGHSLGAQLAPVIAERASGVAGLVLLAPPARPMPRAILQQARFLGQGTPAQLAELEQQAERIVAGKAQPGETFLGVPVGYFVDLMGRDVFGAARRVGRPVLLVRGDRDYQVLGEEQARWQQALAGLPVEAHTLPRLNHQFIAGDGPAGPQDYRKPGRVDASVTRLLSTFVNRTLARGSR